MYRYKVSIIDVNESMFRVYNDSDVRLTIDDIIRRMSNEPTNGPAYLKLNPRVAIPWHAVTHIDIVEEQTGV